MTNSITITPNQTITLTNSGSSGTSIGTSGGSHWIPATGLPNMGSGAISPATSGYAQVVNDIDIVVGAPNGRKYILEGAIHLNKDDELLEDRISRLEKILGVTKRMSVLEDEHSDLKELGEKMDSTIAELDSLYAKAIHDIADSYKKLAVECQTMEKLKENLEIDEDLD